MHENFGSRTYRLYPMGLNAAMLETFRMYDFSRFINLGSAAVSKVVAITFSRRSIQVSRSILKSYGPSLYPRC